ncbi:MAG: TetR/AcrR family transcriptional regulator [Anaerolineae bacterium]|jgi:TetR/AcrR family fatty acid metabolism transcriptional regulator|nr:TetR/AcrR family transcriptional regulator [Anaerolineae bacterium]
MTDTLQQQLIIARKEQILAAAAVVFAAKGFHATTIRDIARQAGIADGTIYNYFGSKTALLTGIFEQMRERVLRQNPLPAPETLDLPAFIRLFIQQPLLALRGDNFALFRIILAELPVNEELRTLYHTQIMQPTLHLAEAYFTAQVAQRGIAPEDARLILRAIAGMVQGLLLQYILGDELLTEQWEQLPELLSGLLLHGLGPDPD